MAERLRNRAIYDLRAEQRILIARDTAQAVLPSKPSRELFGIVEKSVLHHMAHPETWDSPIWLVSIGALATTVSTEQMMHAIHLLDIAQAAGSYIEFDLSRRLTEAFHRPFAQALPKVSASNHGPDGFFLTGGRHMGLGTEAFFVEAKAGDSALKDATNRDGVGRHGSYDAYLSYLIKYTRDNYGISPPPASIILVGISYTPSDDIDLPSNLYAYFDAALLLDAWGKMYWLTQES